MRFFILAVLWFSYPAQAQQVVISENCEVIEGWVTVWIDQIRQARATVIELEINNMEPDEKLRKKVVYVQSEYDRYSDIFNSQCHSEGYHLTD